MFQEHLFEDETNKCSRNVGYAQKIDAGLQPKNF
jgi:hypothetical protein